MFKWFIKPKIDTLHITRQAKARLLHYLEHGDHSELVDVFRDSIIEREDASQYLMIEIEIGSMLQKLKRELKCNNILICDYKPSKINKLNTIYIIEKYIVNEPSTIFILVKMLLIHLGYSNKSQMHLPHMLGRFISESSKV